MAQEELNAKNGWRPMAGWTLLIVISAITAVICYLMIIEKVTLVESAPILMMIIGTLGSVVGIYTHGRTKEKLAGKNADNINIDG